MNDEIYIDSIYKKVNIVSKKGKERECFMPTDQVNGLISGKFNRKFLYMQNKAKWFLFSVDEIEYITAYNGIRNEKDIEEEDFKCY